MLGYFTLANEMTKFELFQCRCNGPLWFPSMDNSKPWLGIYCSIFHNFGTTCSRNLRHLAPTQSQPKGKIGFFSSFVLIV